MIEQIDFEIILPEKKISFRGNKVELDVGMGLQKVELKDAARFIATIKPYLHKFKDLADKLEYTISIFYVRAIYITGLDEYPMPFYLPLTSFDESEKIKNLISEANFSANLLFDELLRTFDSVYNLIEKPVIQKVDEVKTLSEDEIVDNAVKKIKAFKNGTVFTVAEVLSGCGADVKDSQKMFKYYEKIHSQVSNIIKIVDGYIGATVGLPYNIMWEIVKTEN